MVLCDELERWDWVEGGGGVQEAGNICMLVAESYCMTEVNTNCNYPPTQNTFKKTTCIGKGLHQVNPALTLPSSSL